MICNWGSENWEAYFTPKWEGIDHLFWSQFCQTLSTIWNLAPPLAFIFLLCLTICHLFLTYPKGQIRPKLNNLLQSFFHQHSFFPPHFKWQLSSCFPLMYLITIIQCTILFFDMRDLNSFGRFLFSSRWVKLTCWSINTSLISLCFGKKGKERKAKIISYEMRVQCWEHGLLLGWKCRKKKKRAKAKTFLSFSSETALLCSIIYMWNGTHKDQNP